MSSGDWLHESALTTDSRWTFPNVVKMTKVIGKTWLKSDEKVVDMVESCQKWWKVGESWGKVMKCREKTLLRILLILSAQECIYVLYILLCTEGETPSLVQMTLLSIFTSDLFYCPVMRTGDKEKNNHIHPRSAFHTWSTQCIHCSTNR